MRGTASLRQVIWVAAAAAWGHAAAMAQSVAEDQYQDRLTMARGVARAEQCRFVDHGTALMALANLRAMIRRPEVDGRVPDEDRMNTDYQQAVAEGRAATVETCARYGRRPDLLQHQVEVVEMLAYGAGEKPGWLP